MKKWWLLVLIIVLFSSFVVYSQTKPSGNPPAPFWSPRPTTAQGYINVICSGGDSYYQEWCAWLAQHPEDVPASYYSSVTCTSNWQCSAWSACVNNQQSRTCTDANYCGTSVGKPVEMQSCAVSSLTVSISELKAMLIDSIQDYFVSETPKLTVAELKDLIWAYFSTTSNIVNLDIVGKYSGGKLIDIYSKAKGITTCTPSTCSGLGKECDTWSDGCGGMLNCGTCSAGKTCTNGQCVTTGTTPSITVLTPNAPMGTYRAGETYDIRVLCKNIDKVLNIFLIDERIAPPSRSEIMFNFVTCKNAKNDYEWTTYNWTIPLDITSDDRKFVFRIRAETLDSLIGDESDYSFSIDRPLPRVTVLSPNGGETLTIGTDYTIKWDSTLWWAYWPYITDPSVLRLEVYPTSGYYKGIIVDTQDTGSFIWTVGKVNNFLGQEQTLPAGYYNIRITRISAPGGSPVPGATFDESDTPFSIVAK